MSIVFDFDSSKFYLGDLCPKLHSYQNTDKCLRRFTTKKCVQCKVEYDSKRYKANPEVVKAKVCKYVENNQQQVKERKRKYYLENHDSFIAYGTEYRRKNKEIISIRRVEYDKRYREKHRDSIRKQSLRWYKDNAEYCKNIAINRRGRIKSGHHRTVGRADIKERFALFDNKCAFCGCGGKMSIDHFLPIVKGGTHTPGNIIPACLSCNLSKNRNDPDAWYKKQEFFSSQRWKKILKIMNTSEATLWQLPLL